MFSFSCIAVVILSYLALCTVFAAIVRTDDKTPETNRKSHKTKGALSDVAKDERS